MVWHNGGSNQLTGDYRGHEAIMGIFGKLIEVTGGTLRLDIQDVLAQRHARHGAGDRARRARRAAHSPSARSNIWHLADGKATEFWTFPEDSAAVDKIFA